MTFGYGSPGFDPIHCPPCSPGNLCNTVCLDPIDGPLLVAGLTLAIIGSLVFIGRYSDDE